MVESTSKGGALGVSTGESDGKLLRERLGAPDELGNEVEVGTLEGTSELLGKWLMLGKLESDTLGARGGDCDGNSHVEVHGKSSRNPSV